MADNTFDYRFEIDIKRQDLLNAGAKVTVNYDKEPPGNPVSSVEEIQVLHRKGLFALLPAAASRAGVTLLTTYYYVVAGPGPDTAADDEVLWFSDVMLRVSDDRLMAVVPAQYLWIAASDMEPFSDALGTVFGKPFSTLWWPKYAGCISQSLEITAIGDSYKLAGKARLKRHPYGEFCGLMPVPSLVAVSGRDPLRYEDPSRLRQPSHGLVAAAWTQRPGHRAHRVFSRSLQPSLDALTRILRSERSYAVLIMGDPGSGKEVFSQALHFGSKDGWNKAFETVSEEYKNSGGDLGACEAAIRRAKETGGPVVMGIGSLSIAGIGLDEFNQRLFGVDRTPATGSGRAQQALIESLDGGGTLFLDEFDKPTKAKEIYSALLRVLEAKQFVRREVADGRVAMEPRTYKKVNWIMAGAFSQTDARTTVPPDLWSRLTGFIRLGNPVTEDQNYGPTLFMFGYLKSVADLIDDKTIDPLLAAFRKFPSDWSFQESVALRMLGERTQDRPILSEIAPFLASGGLYWFATEFGKSLRTIPTFSGDSIDTARGIIKAAEAASHVVREACIDKAGYWLGHPHDTKSAESALAEASRALRLFRGPA